MYNQAATSITKDLVEFYGRAKHLNNTFYFLGEVKKMLKWLYSIANQGIKWWTSLQSHFMFADSNFLEKSCEFAVPHSQEVLLRVLGSVLNGSWTSGDY